MSNPVEIVLKVYGSIQKSWGFQVGLGLVRRGSQIYPYCNIFVMEQFKLYIGVQMDM